MELDLLVKAGTFESFEDEVFELVVELEGVEVAVRGKGGGQADRRISCECAQLEDAFRTGGLHDYAQEFALKLSGKHAGMVCPDVCLLLDPVKSLSLRSHMILDVFVNLLHYLISVSLWQCDSIDPRRYSFGAAAPP